MEIRDGITYVTDLEAMLMGFYPQYLPKGWKLMKFRSDDNPEKAAEIERFEAERRLEKAKMYAEQNPNDEEGQKDVQDTTHMIEIIHKSTQPQQVEPTDGPPEKAKPSKQMSEADRIIKRAYAKAYYYENRQKVLEYNRQYREKNKEKVRAWQKEYQRSHPLSKERLKERNRRFHDRHPDYNTKENKEARRLARLQKQQNDQNDKD